MSDQALLAVLEEARRHGHLGPGPVVAHLDHARQVGRAARRPYDVAIDLGSGGGVPGLVLAYDDPESTWVLVDRRLARVDDLRRAIRRLSLERRVTALAIDAAELGRDPTYRGRTALVTARSLGPPPEVAELAAPLLRVGGQLLVSEPPGERVLGWPADGLRSVGLVADELEAVGVQSLTLVEPCPDRFPRRRRRSPLW